MIIAPQVSAQDTKQVIMEIMQRQESCWSQGNLECFMEGYWESDSLMFISKDKVHYGYQNTVKRYQMAYPDKEAMGQLSFEFISMQPLSDNSFYVIGKYHLKRTIGDLEGHFTLLWKKINGEWLIVTDHSS
jgi:hypothetical protein